MDWKTITLFISSTFNDMHDERDFIKRHIVSRLNDTLEPYRISVQVTDLRWGIDTHNLLEEEREQKVLHICLDAIENSRPYFIGILGHRYGWIPDSRRLKVVRDQYSLPGEDPCSVTEMEIMLGAISKREYLDHSYFFFRDSSSYDEMDGETRLSFIDGEDGSDLGTRKRNRLISLKGRIENTLSGIPKTRVYKYHARWNGDHFVELDSFGNLLYEALIDDILDQEDISRSCPEDDSLASFLHAKSFLFTGHADLVRRLVNWTEGYAFDPVPAHGLSLRPQNGIILTAPSGAGKSALLAHLAGVLVTEGAPVFTVVAGSSEQMIWFSQIRDRIEELPQGTIILIDGIERIPDCNVLADFLSSNRMFGHPYLCTCTDDYFGVFEEEFRFYQSLSSQKGSFERVPLPSLGSQDAQELISRVLIVNHKELSSGIRDSLLKSVMTEKGTPDIHAPFRLRIALNILMEMGSDDFRSIRRLAIDDDAHKIESYLKAKVDSFPASLSGMIRYYLQLTLDLFDQELAEAVLIYLSLSRFGLTTEDLEILCGESWNPLEFGSMCFWLRPLVQKNTYTGKYSLSHTLVKRSICQLFETDLPRYQDSFEQVVVERFHEGKMGADEYLYSLIRCHDVHLFYSCQEENGVPSRALGLYLLDDEEDGIAFLRELMREYRDSSMENVLYAISAGYTAETKRCRQLEERAKAIRQGYFTKEELLSGNFKTLFSYFSTVLSRLDDEPSLFKEAHDLFLENRARYGSGLAQSGLVNSYFSCWEKYLLSLHERYRSIYREESGLATDGGSVDYDRIAKREHEVELLTSEELQCLLEECKWFRDCADPMTTVLLYRNLWGRKLRFLTGKGNLDTDINVRIAAYQQIQAQLWSLYPTILGSGDEWNIQRFNDAAGELVDTYRRLFHIFSNTPFQPTELSEYLDRLS